MVRDTNSYHNTPTEQTGAAPLPIVSVAPVEGTDFPFYTRFYIGQPVKAKRRGHSGFAGRPHTIFEAENDNSLLFFGKVIDAPSNWINWRRNKRTLAYQGMWVSPPMFYFERPFTDYQDNLCRLLSEIQRHLLEPVIDDGHTWSFHTRDEVLTSVDQRIARILVETGVLRKRVSIAINANIAEYNLPTDLIEIRRISLEGSPLARMDDFLLDNATPGWQTMTGVPYAYIEEPRPSLTIRLVPIPTADATIVVNYVPLPDAVSNCNPLPLPATMIPYVKWGVLADLLSKEGEANDPQRATYCEERFVEGVALIKALIGTEI